MQYRMVRCVCMHSLGPDVDAYVCMSQVYNNLEMINIYIIIIPTTKYGMFCF